MTQQRTTILDAVKTRLAGFYGPSGTEEKIFRQTRRGPLQPTDVSMRPCLTVTDDGQERVAPWGDDTEERQLRILVTLHLAETWDRQAAVQEWGDNVERIVTKLANWCPTATGALQMNYVRDDPFDVIFTSGGSEAVWVIEFACRYFVEQGGVRSNW